MLTALFPDPASEAYAFMAVVLVLLYLLLRWRSAARQRKKDRSSEIWVLVDGSNVMHWLDNKPQLAPVLQVVKHLKALGYVPGVVFDANAGWKLEGRYLHDGDFAKLLKLEPRQVMVVSKGTPADPFLLMTADEFGAKIVTNDRFRDWAEAHPKVKESGFLIRGGYRNTGEFWLEDVTRQPASAAA